jgi:hypothetical protein
MVTLSWTFLAAVQPFSMSKDCKRDSSVTCTSPAYYNDRQRTKRLPERITWLSCVLCNKGGVLVDGETMANERNTKCRRSLDCMHRVAGLSRSGDDNEALDRTMHAAPDKQVAFSK